jgi:hypothetical protein
MQLSQFRFYGEKQNFILKKVRIVRELTTKTPNLVIKTKLHHWRFFLIQQV